MSEQFQPLSDSVASDILVWEKHLTWHNTPGYQEDMTRALVHLRALRDENRALRAALAALVGAWDEYDGAPLAYDPMSEWIESARALVQVPEQGGE